MPPTPPRFIEISHVIEPGMVTYPGLPPPEVKVIVDHESSRARYQNKSEFLIASRHLCGNTGTYVDSPLHRHRGATDLAALPLERLAHVPAAGEWRPAARCADCLARRRHFSGARVRAAINGDIPHFAVTNRGGSAIFVASAIVTTK